MSGAKRSRRSIFIDAISSAAGVWIGMSSGGLLAFVASCASKRPEPQLPPATVVTVDPEPSTSPPATMTLVEPAEPPPVEHEEPEAEVIDEPPPGPVVVKYGAPAPPPPVAPKYGVQRPQTLKYGAPMPVPAYGAPRPQ